ncbi:O-antigen polymerase [Clostridium perfringens]|uniref:O-antigen polymerase n=2 Tax=Clostridium perfringens TaxID=1502 RepID=UPI0024BBF232|nr:O-antigen polymerase [Clostridium perfringens]
MFFLTDWFLIIITTILTYKSYKRIIDNRFSSFANFVLLIEYVFCCLPILLNYLIGIPNYNTVYWYKAFLPSMNNQMVAIIYDVYIGTSFIILYIYAFYYDKYKSPKKLYRSMSNNTLLTNKFILIVVILSPIFYIIITGNLSFYKTYGLNSNRGLTNESYNMLMSMLILLSLYAFCYYFFSKKITKASILGLIIYSFILGWIQGKRFIFAVMGMSYLFYYTRSELSKKQKRKLKLFLPIALVLLMAFSYYYLVKIRPLSDTYFDSVYQMLRVDFGRDDVIKYVIYNEFFIKNHILDYPGQSFLSTFLTFIPRSIWASKPYPHYMYLTASILNLPIFNLPAGTTPSWFEMCLANLGYFGYFFGVISIPLICKGIDKIKSIPIQMLSLILVIALLTQSIDAYLIFLLIFIMQILIRILFNDKRIKIKWR